MNRVDRDAGVPYVQGSCEVQKEPVRSSREWLSSPSKGDPYEKNKTNQLFRLVIPELFQWREPHP